MTRNYTFRADQIKKFWVDNSDAEQTEDEIVTQREILCQDGIKNTRRQFNDEYFPVTICKKSQYLNIPDPTCVFTYDRLEHVPEFVILNNRS